MVEISIPLTVVSAITIAATTILLLSFVVWRRVLHKTLNVAIFYTVTSYLLASIGTVVGQPKTNDVCSYQGIMSNIFILSSVSWTTMITYLLFSNLKFSKNQHKRIRTPFYLVCFGIPILLTFVPLINATYGSQPGLWRCEMINTTTSPSTAQIFWLWMSFYGWIWFNMLICLLLNIQVMITLYRAKSTENFKRFQTIVINYAGYPIIVSLCWLPATITDTLTVTHPDMIISDGALQLSAIMSCSVGTLTTIYFWRTGGKDMIGWWTQYFTSGCDKNVQYKAYSTTDTSSHQSAHNSGREKGLSIRFQLSRGSSISGRSRNENGSVMALNTSRSGALRSSVDYTTSRPMRSSIDYSSRPGNATARSSNNNMAALAEATNAVVNYESLPPSSNNLENMVDASVVTSTDATAGGTATTTVTGDPKLTDEKPMETMQTTVPFAGSVPLDTTYNDDYDVKDIKRKRKGSAGNSVAAGLLGVSMAVLENKDASIPVNLNNSNKDRRKSSLISNTVLDLLGVGGRVVPVDTPSMAVTPPQKSSTHIQTSTCHGEDEKDTARRS